MKMSAWLLALCSLALQTPGFVHFRDKLIPWHRHHLGHRPADDGFQEAAVVSPLEGAVAGSGILARNLRGKKSIAAVLSTSASSASSPSIRSEEHTSELQSLR